MKRIFAVLAAVTVLFQFFVYAQNDSSPQIVITSEKFNYYRNKNYFEYMENVKVVEDDKILTCDYLRAYIDPEEQVMTFVRASGNIVITDGERLLRSSMAEYDRVKEVIRLTGEPVLYENESKITGDEIIIDVIEETVEVRGNVRAELYTNE